MTNTNNSDKLMRLSEEEEKQEDKEIKMKILADIFKSTLEEKNVATPKKKKKIRSPKNDGVIVPGICPYCGSKLKAKADKYGGQFTVCERYTIDCPFYYPYKLGHFR